MQIEKALIIDRLRVSKVSCIFRIPTTHKFCSKFAIFLKSSLPFNSFYCPFYL